MRAPHEPEALLVARAAPVVRLHAGLRGRSRVAWDSNPESQAYETRLSTRPPAKEDQLRTRELNPAIQAYETRPGARPSAKHSSGDGGIRTHTVHVLSVATPSVGLHHHSSE